MHYISILFLLLFSAPAFADVVNTECQPGPFIEGGTEEYQAMDCTIWTDDAGAFVVHITTDVARLRVNEQGALIPQDLDAFRNAVRSAYRAEIVSRRQEEARRKALEEKRAAGRLRLDPAAVE